MSTIRVKTMGMGFGTDPAEISVRCQGTTVFEGPIATRFELYVTKLSVADLSELFQFSTAPGLISMEYQVNKNAVVFGSVLVDKAWIDNPIYTTQELEVLDNPSSSTETLMQLWQSKSPDPFTQEEITQLTSGDTDSELEAKGLQRFVFGTIDGFRKYEMGDARINVMLDNQPFAPDRTEDTEGLWFYRVDEGQILRFDLDLTPFNI